jgi:hypothetical protein
MLGRCSAALFVVLYAACAVPPADEVDDDPAGGDGKADVYGSDDRMERYQFLPTSTLRYRLARSSGMLAMRGLVNPRADGDYELFEPRTLAQTGVCSDERFADQPEVGYCSATLVAPDLVVTSGHCMKNVISGLTGAQHKCESTYMVFDFAYEFSRPSDPVGVLRKLPAGDVFQCVEVLAAEIPEDGLPKQDYALLRLDRPVPNRAPVPVYDGPDLDDGAGGIQIGHPSGLPQKIAPARIYEHLDPTRYAAYRYRADILGGNSGGGVFTTHGTLFGIPTLYSGQNYVVDTTAPGECLRTAVCGVNTECPTPPGAYDTASMLDRLPDDLKQQLTIDTE